MACLPATGHIRHRARQVETISAQALALSLALIQCVQLANAREMRLTIEHEANASKPRFALNGKSFYPLIYAENFSNLSPEQIRSVRQRGFNSLQIGIDTEDTASEVFSKFMEACAAEQLPVFLELNDWQIRQVLIERPTLNMVMAGGERVEYFPDYANPATKREHLRRFSRASKRLHPYLGRPIIAISVGAYDAYHLPDSEVHADFVVPAHSKKGQTHLPYGRYAEAAFRKYSAVSTPSSQTRDAPQKCLPTVRAEAESDEVWREWLNFRRTLVADWLRNTVRAVRNRSNVPIGVSYDLNFAGREQFATPPAAWREILDFVAVYCYGRQKDAGYISSFMQIVRREFNDDGVPMIGFLEFSSGLAGNARGDGYAAHCAPFVSGLMVTGPIPEQKHPQERIDEFINWANGQGELALLSKDATAPDLVLVLDRRGIDLGRPMLAECNRSAVQFDVLYVDKDWNGRGVESYSLVAIERGVPKPPNSRLRTGQQVIDGDDLRNELERQSTPQRP